MKYKGKKLEGRNKEVIPIPRSGGDIIFIAEAVDSFDEFDKLVPEPKPPIIIKPGNVKIENTKDKKYLEALEEHNKLRTHFLVIKSLKDSPDLEWETVDFSKSETWPNYEKELKEAGLNDIEIGRIVMGVMRANSLDETMIEEARNNFLHGQGEPDS